MRSRHAHSNSRWFRRSRLIVGAGFLLLVISQSAATGDLASVLGRGHTIAAVAFLITGAALVLFRLRYERLRR